MSTTQNPWKVLSQASVDQTSVNITHLAYVDDDTVKVEPKAAQTFTNKPEASVGSDGYIKGAKPFGVNDDFIALRFAIADTDNDVGVCTIWTWDGNGAAWNALILDPIRAGSRKITTNPENGKPLTNFFYADHITISENNANAVRRGKDANNDIIELRFDLRGAQWVFADFDMDANAGTDGTDGICWYKTWGSS